MSRSSPIRPGCSPLRELRHVCAFFNDDDEAYRVLAPFIAEGFACDDKAVHIIRADQEAEHLRMLAEAGIDVDAARSRGQLELRRNADTYLIDGKFDQDRMLAAFEEMAGGDAEGGFARSRIVCDMDWDDDHGQRHDDLVEFEARVNEIWQRHDDIVICVYDSRKLSGAMVIDIMRTHPAVVIGGVLHENPFFTPPRQFLSERRASRDTEAMSS